jgi:glyoxylase-like metal-dependent hydrolase (beta-lactamase superfamily II)
MVQPLDPILLPDHPPLRTFSTASGARIFQLPLELFPGFWGYAYLVLVSAPDGAPMRVLIDCGSGFGYSNAHLEAGLAAVSVATGITTHLEDLTHILITHGHIDHFGGLSHIRQLTSAKLGFMSWTSAS